MNTHSSPKTLSGGGTFQSIWGCHDICPLLRSFHATSTTQSELSSLTSLKVWGDPEKFKSKVAFLLTLTGWCTEEDWVFGLSMMWVHLYQARAPTMEEVVKQLTPLPYTGSDCPYALVWLNGDAHHVLLPKERYLSIQVTGGASNSTCRRVIQLYVCQLLSLVSQIVYPIRFNGCEVPVIASPPEPMAKGVNLLGSKPIYLKVDIPQPPWRGQNSKLCPSAVTLLLSWLQALSGIPTKGRRRGQHDHRDERAPIPGGFGYIWAHIRELNPKDVGAHGPSHTFAHQTGRFSQASGHVIPGEHPSTMLKWRMPPWRKYLLLLPL